MAEMIAKVIASREALRRTPAGIFVKTMIIDFMVNDHGPFSIEIDMEKFTPELAREMINKRVAEIQELVGE